MQDEEQPNITIDELARMMANGFGEIRDQFATLEQHIGDVDGRVLSVERGVNGLKYKVDQVELKLDEHRQETKDGFAGVHRLIGGISTSLADHEDRLQALPRPVFASAVPRLDRPTSRNCIAMRSTIWRFVSVSICSA